RIPRRRDDLERRPLVDRVDVEATAEQGERYGDERLHEADCEVATILPPASAGISNDDFPRIPRITTPLSGSLRVADHAGAVLVEPTCHPRDVEEAPCPTLIPLEHDAAMPARLELRDR